MTEPPPELLPFSPLLTNAIVAAYQHVHRRYSSRRNRPDRALHVHFTGHAKLLRPLRVCSSLPDSGRRRAFLASGILVVVVPVDVDACVVVVVVIVDAPGIVADVVVAPGVVAVAVVVVGSVGSVGVTAVRVTDVVSHCHPRCYLYKNRFDLYHEVPTNISWITME